MSTIVEFYSGTGTDHRGRHLAEIQSWSAEQLEQVHDFIQWLFPLPEPSPVNPLAPVLDRETIEEFRRRDDLREALRRSLRMMTEFYGFEWSPGPPGIVEKSDRFKAAAANWLQPGNHNHLRITRILRATRLLGLEAESAAFYQALVGLYKADSGRSGITPTTFRYWTEAMQGG